MESHQVVDNFLHWRAQEFCSLGVAQQIQLRTERTGIWGAVAP